MVMTHPMDTSLDDRQLHVPLNCRLQLVIPPNTRPTFRWVTENMIQVTLTEFKPPVNVSPKLDREFKKWVAEGKSNLAKYLKPKKRRRKK